MCVIGFSHAEKICPWCDKRFGYNNCKPFDGLIAHKKWKDHVDKHHKKEYDTLIESTLDKHGYVDFDTMFDLDAGILPEEGRKKRRKTLQKKIDKKVLELEKLKGELKNI